MNGLFSTNSAITHSADEIRSIVEFYLSQNYTARPLEIIQKAKNANLQEYLYQYYELIILTRQGRFKKVLSEITSLENDVEFELGALILKSYVLKNLGMKSEMKQVEGAIKEARTTADAVKLYYAALSFYHIHDFVKFKMYLDKALKKLEVSSKNQANKNLQERCYGLSVWFTLKTEKMSFLGNEERCIEMVDSIKAHCKNDLLAQLVTAILLKDFTKLAINYEPSVCLEFQENFRLHVYPHARQLLSKLNVMTDGSSLFQRFYECILDMFEGLNNSQNFEVNFDVGLLLLEEGNHEIISFIVKNLINLDETSILEQIFPVLKQMVKSGAKEGSNSAAAAYLLLLAKIDNYLGLKEGKKRSSVEKFINKIIEINGKSSGTVEKTIVADAQLLLAEVKNNPDMIDIIDEESLNGSLDLRARKMVLKGLKHEYSNLTRELKFASDDNNFQYINLLIKMDKNSSSTLKFIISRVPSLKSVNKYLAKIYFSEQRFTEALQCIERASRGSHDAGSIDIDYIILSAEVYLSVANPEMALTIVNSEIANDFKLAENNSIKVIKARALVATGRSEEARKLLQGQQSDTAINLELMKLEEDPKRVKSIMSLCVKPSLEMEIEYLKKLESSNLISQALDYSRKIVIEDTQINQDILVDYEILVANLLTKTGDSQTANIQLRDLYERMPGNPKVLEALGQLMYDQGDLNNAIRTFEMAISVFPENKRLMEKLVQALIGTHNFEAALSYYDKCKHEAFRLPLINLLIRLGRFEKAEQLIKASELPNKNELLGDVYCEWEQGMHCVTAYKQSGIDYIKENEIGKYFATIYKLSIFYIRNFELLPASQLLEDSLKQYAPKESIEASCDEALLCRLTLAKVRLMSDKRDECFQACDIVMDKCSDGDKFWIMAMEIIAEMNKMKGDLKSASASYERIIKKMLDGVVVKSKKLSSSQMKFNTGILIRAVKVFKLTGGLEKLKLEDLKEKGVFGQSETAYLLVLGLSQWASNNTHSAILTLNKVRRQEHYGIIASEAIFDICVRVAYDHAIGISGRAKSYENFIAAQQLCQQLFGELIVQSKRNQKTDAKTLNFYDTLSYSELSQTHQIRLSLYQCLSFADKTAVNENPEAYRVAKQAKERLAQLSQSNNEHSINKLDTSSAMLAQSLVFLLTNETQRAKTIIKAVADNISKRRVENKPSFGISSMLDFDENLTWLLLAELSLLTHKPGCLETAGIFIKKRWDREVDPRCLEILGMECEQSGDNEKALEFYFKAWENYSDKMNVSTQLVYRLAEMLLKENKIIDCIEVCNSCLEVQPDHVRLREDILQEARRKLRT